MESNLIYLSDLSEIYYNQGHVASEATMCPINDSDFKWAVCYFTECYTNALSLIMKLQQLIRVYTCLAMTS